MIGTEAISADGPHVRLVGDRPDIGNPQAVTDPGFPALDVTVAASERYLLSSPWPTTIVASPVLAKIIEPSVQRSNDTVSSGLGEEDDTAVTVAVPNEVTDQLDILKARAELYDEFLRKYGEQGVSDISSDEPSHWETDERMKLAIDRTIYALRTLDDTTIGKYKQNSETLLSIPNYSESQVLKYLPLDFYMSNAMDGISKLFDPPLPRMRWPPLIHKAALYLIRENSGVDSANYYIAAGPSSFGSVPPNSPDIFQDTSLFPEMRSFSAPLSPLVEFRIRRDETSSDLQPVSLHRFINYWTTVRNLNLFNDADINFIHILDSKHPELHLNMAQTVDLMISECQEALSSYSRWSRASTILRLHVTHDPNFSSDAQFSAALTDSSLQLGSATISNFVASAAFALSSARGQEGIGRPESSYTSTAWVATQWRTSFVYGGKLIFVHEDSGINCGSVCFELIEPRFGDPIDVFGGNRDEIQMGTITHDIGAGRSITEPEPFYPLVWQSIALVSPAAEIAIRPNASADEIYNAGALIEINRSELLGNIRKAAPAVREYGQELFRNYIKSVNSLRNGRFSVPESAQVDSVSVIDGQSVEAGDPIATLRPLYRYELSAVVAPAYPDVVLLTTIGATVHFQLQCSGVFQLNSRVKSAILASAHAQEISAWLKKVKQQYLAATLFTGNVAGAEVISAKSIIRTKTKQVSSYLPRMAFLRWMFTRANVVSNMRPLKPDTP